MTNLQLAAKCTMADLLGEYEKGGLEDAAKRSICLTYDALRKEGVDVQDYETKVENVRQDLDGSGKRVWEEQLLCRMAQLAIPDSFFSKTEKLLREYGVTFEKVDTLEYDEGTEQDLA